MKTFYQITTKEIGVIMLRRRKIAKAYRWWLRENGFDCKSTHCITFTSKYIPNNQNFVENKTPFYTYQKAKQTDSQNSIHLIHHQEVDL